MNKNILALAIFTIFNFISTEVSANAQTIRKHDFSVKIQPKDDTDTTLFAEKAQQLFEALQTAHRTQNGSNLYNQILIFIKETQEAIAAGLNLFSTASSSSSVQIIEAIEEAVTEETPVVLAETATPTMTPADATTPSTDVATDTASEAAASDAQPEHKVIMHRNIEINITISLEKTDDENLFDALIAKMNNLAQALNENSHSAEEIATMFNDVILASHHLPNTNLVIKIN